MIKLGFVEIEVDRIKTCQNHQTRSGVEVKLAKFDLEKRCDEQATEAIARWLIEQDMVIKRRVDDDDGTLNMYYYLQVIAPIPEDTEDYPNE